MSKNKSSQHDNARSMIQNTLLNVQKHTLDVDDAYKDIVMIILDTITKDTALLNKSIVLLMVSEFILAGACTPQEKTELSNAISAFLDIPDIKEFVTDARRRLNFNSHNMVENVETFTARDKESKDVDGGELVGICIRNT